MQTLPYGAWPSPLDAAEVARNDGAPNWPRARGEEVWWTEPRPAEGGRVTLCRARLDTPDAAPEAVLPAPWNIRSRVHEYGGAPYLPVPDPGGGSGTAIVFAEFSDQRLYLYRPDTGAQPQPLTPAPDRPSGLRYAEPVAGPAGEIWCIRERLTGPAPTDLERAIVAVPLDGSAAGDPGAVRTVAAGRRFLTCPRRSPDGRMLSWIGWDHPDMPWDSTYLSVAAIGPDGTAAEAHDVAGGPGESVVQAEWGAESVLFAVSDASGWWNPYQIVLDGVPHQDSAPRPPVALAPLPQEFGGPLWQLGATWILPLQCGLIAAVHGTGDTRLSLLCPDSGSFTAVDTPHTEFSPRLTAAGAAGDTLVTVAASPDLPSEVVAVSVADGSWRSLSRSGGGPEVPPDLVPRPEPRVFTGPGGREVHATVYPPRNPAAQAPEGELPPYAVWVHGGPTGRAATVLDPEVAYFTSRGIGVAEVNYGGSTGYGRAYRERLRENWGVVDVEDCAAVADALAAEGLADPARIAVRGGSAGGWTSAAAITEKDTPFACAAISYPIVDLVGWRTGETHDFESQYLESLVGPWPQTRARYELRSPVNRADRVSAPFVLLQGDEDAICPPVQAERFVERVRGRGVPHAYLLFQGEQHGFRKAETITAALRAELSLYAQVFGFDGGAEASGPELSR
ncbi:S9 family peptidase [Nocardiopsis coralliicola]